MAGRRVVVDLSAYFVDHRRKSLIFLGRDCIKSVENLVNHICKIFSLEDEFEIFISDAHVPRSECADIIQDGDVLRVEKVHDQPNVSGPSLHCETSKNDDEELPSDNPILPSKKKKKRKAVKCDVAEDEKLTEENASEAPSSCVTFSSEEPRKKKKKKKPLNDTQDCSLEATCDNQTLTSESRKGKKKSADTDKTQECSQYYLAEEDSCNRSNVFNTKQDVFNTKSNPIEPDNVWESTQISKSYHIGKTEEESSAIEDVSNSVDVSQERSGEMSMTLSSVLDESTDSTKVATSSLCEIVDGSIGSTSVRKRRRPRRRKPKKCRIANAPTFNESKVSVCEPSHIAVSKRIKDIVNNCHVRFSDGEGSENMDEIPEVVDRSPSMELSSVCSNGDSIGLKDMSSSTVIDAREYSAAKTVPDNKWLMRKSDAKCVDHNNDQQMSQEDMSVGEDDIRMPENVNGGSVVKDSVVERVVMCEDNGVSQNVNCESVVKDSVVERVANGNNNYACKKEVSSEDRASKPGNKPSVVNPQGKGSRRRNVIIAMGLGATLSHLIKESNLPNKEASPPQKSFQSLTKESNLPNKEESVQQKSCESLQTSNKRCDLQPKPVKTPKDRRYGGFPVLEKFPRRGDILAFKVLRLNERYEPIVSGYLEGKIMNCDETSTQVTVEVLGGAEELRKFTGKFDLEEEGEDTTVASGKKNELKILQLKWSEFIEPRLVFP